MRPIKIFTLSCLLFFSVSSNAIIIDYSVEGTVSSLSGTRSIVGMSEGDKVYASWTVDTQQASSQKILSTLPSFESGKQAVSSLAIENAITNFSLTLADSSIITSANTANNSLYIGENGAPPSDTQSIHDSGINIGDLDNGADFSLIDLTGICCNKSVLLEDIQSQNDPAAYMLSGFSFGWGIFTFIDASMNWAAEYDYGTVTAKIRSYAVPIPSPVYLLIIGLMCIYRRRAQYVR